jgi:hypothetical protein
VIISSALGNAKGFAAVEKFTAGVSFRRCAPPRSSSVTESSLHIHLHMRVQSSALDMFQIFYEYEAAILKVLSKSILCRWLLQVDTLADLMEQDT